MAATELSVTFRWQKAIAASDLPSTARAVAWTLSFHMDRSGGSCFPSMATITRESGLAESTCRKYIVQLEQEGHLIVDRSRGRHANRYRAVLKREPLRRDRVEPDGPQGVAGVSTPSKRERKPPGASAEPTGSEPLGSHEEAKEVGVRHHGDESGQAKFGGLPGWPRGWARDTLARHLTDLGATDSEGVHVAAQLLRGFQAGRLKPSRGLVATELRQVREAREREGAVVGRKEAWIAAHRAAAAERLDRGHRDCPECGGLLRDDGLCDYCDLEALPTGRSG